MRSRGCRRYWRRLRQLSRAPTCAPRCGWSARPSPPPGAEDPDDWRAELLGGYQTVIGFLKLLPAVISFGATAEGAPVLAAMQTLPDVLAYRSRLPAPLIPGKLIKAGVVSGP